MPRPLAAARVASLLAALAAPACHDAGAPADLGAPDAALPPPVCTDPVPPDGGVPATFANVQRIFDGNCLFSCHCCSSEVDLTLGHAWADLVGVTAPPGASSGDIACGTLVTPGDPAHSYLYQKLTQAKPCSGAQMPLSEFGAASLPDCELDLVRRWIAAGAPND